MDLSAGEFELLLSGTPTTTLFSNVAYSYTFRVGLRKTAGATVREASSLDINDVSLELQMFLSVDDSVSDEDVELHVPLTLEQLTHARRGVCEETGTVYSKEITKGSEFDISTFPIFLQGEICFESIPLCKIATNSVQYLQASRTSCPTRFPLTGAVRTWLLTWWKWLTQGLCCEDISSQFTNTGYRNGETCLLLVP